MGLTLAKVSNVFLDVTFVRYRKTLNGKISWLLSKVADVLRWESIKYAQVELWGVADVRDAG